MESVEGRERNVLDAPAGVIDAVSWVVFHLIDHEVEHRVRMSAIRDAFRN